MKCKKCGKEVGKNDSFCQYCGTEIKKESKTSKTAIEKRAEVKEEVKVEKVETKTENKSGNGLAIAGMVLGIIGIVLSLIIGPFAFLFPLLGLILSLCGKKSGYKIAGIITSICGFIIGIIYIIIGAALISGIFSLIDDGLDSYDDLSSIKDDYKEYSNYKYATPYGEWTCVPYPETANGQETTLDLKYSGKFVYGPSDDLDNNHYSGTWTYEKEYDKNKEYTDREFVDIKAPVTEFIMGGITQDASNKNLNMEMEFINDYDEAIIMFYNTNNTYKCTK